MQRAPTKFCHMSCPIDLVITGGWYPFRVVEWLSCPRYQSRTGGKPQSVTIIFILILRKLVMGNLNHVSLTREVGCNGHMANNTVCRSVLCNSKKEGSPFLISSTRISSQLENVFCYVVLPSSRWQVESCDSKPLRFAFGRRAETGQ